MKKLVFISLLIVFLLLLVIPGAVGVVAENEFRKLSEGVDSETPGLRLVVEDYRRGWFSSQARYRLSFTHPALEATLRDEHDDFTGLPSLVSEAEIAHGLLPFAAMGRDGSSFSPVIAQSFDKLSVELGNGEVVSLPARVTTRLAISGMHRNEIEIAAFEHDSDDSGSAWKLTWDGLALSTSFDSNLDKLALDGQSGAIEIRSEEYRLHAGPVRMESQHERTDYGLWVGDGRVAWQGLQIEIGDKLALSMGELLSEAKSDITEGMMDQAFSVTLSKVAVANWEGGPGRLSVNLDRLDAEAIGRLTEMMRQYALAGEEEDLTAEIMPLIFPQLQALLAGGPHFVLEELSLGTPQGKVLLTADLAFPESSPEAAFGFIIGLVGEAKLRVPAALMENLRAMDPEGAAGIRKLAEAGFLIRNEDTLVMDAVLKGGLLTINGQPIPLPLTF